MAETQATGTSCGKWGRPGCSWWSMGRAVGRITMGQITIWWVNLGDVPKNDVSWKIHDFPTCSHNGRGYQLVLTMDGPPQSLSKTALWIYRDIYIYIQYMLLMYIMQFQITICTPARHIFFCTYTWINMYVNQQQAGIHICIHRHDNIIQSHSEGLFDFPQSLHGNRVLWLQTHGL